MNSINFQEWMAEYIEDQIEKAINKIFVETAQDICKKLENKIRNEIINIHVEAVDIWKSHFNLETTIFSKIVFEDRRKKDE